MDMVFQIGKEKVMKEWLVAKGEYVSNNILDKLEQGKCKLIKQLKLSKDNLLQLKTEMNAEEHKGISYQRRILIKDHRPHGLIFDKNAIANFTLVNIPEHILQALSFGPKFVTNVDHENLNLLSTLAETESIIQNNAKFTKSMVRTHTKYALDTYEHKNSSNPWFNLIFEDTTQFFNENKDIVTLSCDKGKIVAVMYKDDYYNGLDKLINTEDYIIISDKKVLVIKSQHKAFLRILQRLKHINQFEYDRAIAHTEQLPKFYGLPKIHKIKKINDVWQTQHGVPMRPIVACCGSIGYELSIIIKNWLEIYFPSDELNIIRTDIFVEEIRKVKMNERDRIMSFDIRAMFSSIPYDKIEDIIKQKKDEINEKFDFDLLIRMVRFIATECGIFTYKNTKYIQTKGVGMGTCISPLFARMLYQDIIVETKKKINFNWSFFRYFVDDSICILENGLENALLEAFNCYHLDIEFTMEFEDNNQINFLNTTIIREKDKVVTNWYKKDFASNRLVNYHSNHEKHTVTGTAIGFIRTVVQLSDAKFFNENKEKVILTLRENNFPETEIIGLVNTYYTYMKNTIKCRKPVKEDEIKFKSLPWLPNTTWKIRDELRRFCKVHISGRPIRPTIIGSNIKDKIDKNLEKHSILKATCKCNKKVDFIYTGNRTILEVSRELTTNGKCNTLYHSIHKVVNIKSIAKVNARPILTNFLAYINKEHLLSIHPEPELSWKNYIDANKGKFEHLRHKVKIPKRYRV